MESSKVSGWKVWMEHPSNKKSRQDVHSTRMDQSQGLEETRLMESTNVSGKWKKDETNLYKMTWTEYYDDFQVQVECKLW